MPGLAVGLLKAPGRLPVGGLPQGRGGWPKNVLDAYSSAYCVWHAMRGGVGASSHLEGGAAALFVALEACAQLRVVVVHDVVHRHVALLPAATLPQWEVKMTVSRRAGARESQPCLLT